MSLSPSEPLVCPPWDGLNFRHGCLLLWALCLSPRDKAGLYICDSCILQPSLYVLPICYYSNPLLWWDFLAFFFFFFLTAPMTCRNSWTRHLGIALMPQQWSEPQQWQCQILNLLSHKLTPIVRFFILNFNLLKSLGDFCLLFYCSSYGRSTMFRQVLLYINVTQSHTFPCAA